MEEALAGQDLQQLPGRITTAEFVQRPGAPVGPFAETRILMPEAVDGCEQGRPVAFDQRHARLQLLDLGIALWSGDGGKDLIGVVAAAIAGVAGDILQTGVIVLAGELVAAGAQGVEGGIGLTARQPADGVQPDALRDGVVAIEAGVVECGRRPPVGVAPQLDPVLFGGGQLAAEPGRQAELAFRHGQADAFPQGVAVNARGVVEHREDRIAGIRLGMADPPQRHGPIQPVLAAGGVAGGAQVIAAQFGIAAAIEALEALPLATAPQVFQPVVVQTRGQRRAGVLLQEGGDVGIVGAREAPAQPAILEIGVQGIVAQRARQLVEAFQLAALQRIQCLAVAGAFLGEGVGQGQRGAGAEQVQNAGGCRAQQFIH